MNINIIQADYAQQQHARDIVRLLDDYARDPMGGGTPLAQETRRRVVERLAQLPHAFTLLAYHEQKAVAMANCFEAFSTFSAQPLINIHDFMVAAAYRGRGISQLLLQHVEQVAKGKGCCKITLEVLTGNAPARSAYTRFGFSAYRMNSGTGIAEFWQKPLTQVG